MKRIIVVLMVMVSVFGANAQSTFRKLISGGSQTSARSVEKTNDGGFIIAGSKDNFQGDSLDVYLVKTDANGAIQWSKMYGGIHYDAGGIVHQTSDGGYIIGGERYDLGAGGYNFYIIKTNSIGDTLWTKTYDGGYDDWLGSIEQTTDGGYIIGGVTYHVGIDGNTKPYIIKTTSNGDTVWTKTFMQPGYCYGNSVTQTNDGSYLVSFSGTGLLDTSTLIWGNAFVTLMKLNNGGSVNWTQQYTYSSISEMQSLSAFAMQESDGKYIVSGIGINQDTGTYNSYYIFKTDSIGNVDWTRAYEYGTDWSGVISIGQAIPTTDGGFVIGGQVSACPIFDTGYQYCNANPFLLKLDTQGLIEWNKMYVGTGSYGGAAMAIQTSDGGYFMVGDTSNATYSVSTSNILFIKTDSLGRSGCPEANEIAWNGYDTLSYVGNISFSSVSGCIVKNTTTHVINGGGTVSDFCGSVGVPSIKDTQLSIDVYPNPATSSFTISSTEKIKELKVFNLLGELIYQAASHSNQATINSNPFDNGIYFVQVLTDKGTINKKIVKQ